MGAASLASNTWGAPIRAQVDTLLSQTQVPGALALLNEQGLGGGKQMRPALLLTLGSILGVPRSRLLAYAQAAERVHAATLLHDDVVDQAVERRGRPTLNSQGHNRKAVLGGDLLLAHALASLSAHMGAQAHREAIDDGAEGVDPRVHAAVVAEMHHTLVALVEGEWLQLEGRGVARIEEAQLVEITKKKTASLLAWCCSTPARLAGSSDAELESYRGFGRHFGVSFQILDDVLDFEPGTGKPMGQDLFEGQCNWVVYRVLRTTPELRARVEAYLEAWQEREAPLRLVGTRDPRAAVPLLEDPEFVAALPGAKQWAREQAELQCESAIAYLEPLLAGRDGWPPFVKALRTWARRRS